MKALFKINADESTFTRTIDVAAEIEDAAKVAKETVFGSIPERVQKAKGFLQTQKKVLSTEKHKGKCYRCEKAGHLAPDCYFKNLLAITVSFKVIWNLFARKRKAKRQ